MIGSASADRLRCPTCFRPLSPTDDAGRTFGCDSGHRFDVNRRGYISLLGPKRSAFIADSAVMLDARATFLTAGHYAPIADAVASAAASRSGQGAESTIVVADLGCGTGYYSAAVRAALPNAEFIVSDLSPEAVRRAVRGNPASLGLVADIWAPLPLVDDGIDVILNVFAPRHASEFLRVLRPGGTLVTVVPTEHHLTELRVSGHAIEVQADKADRVIASFGGFALEDRARVEYSMDLDESDVEHVIAMGPSAHHRFPDATTSLPSRVTVSVDVLTFVRGSFD